jgi:polyhydroxyalkanoate synthesis regulator phasin
MSDADHASQPETESAGPDTGGGDAAGRAGTKGRRRKAGDGIRQGLGFLSAFKDALEETIQEARDRGDLSGERAREVMKEALDKAHAAGERARERLDFAPQGDVDAVSDALDGLVARVRRLEEHAFGAAQDAAAGPDDGAA